MANLIKLRKGLDIKLKGKSVTQKTSIAPSNEFTILPDAFEGVSPKVTVHVGDEVKAGETIFINKHFPDVKFSSPVSGVIDEIIRGERRKILGVRIKRNSQEIEYVDFGKKDVSQMTSEQVIQSLLEAGLFGYINQLPYAISTNSTITPKAIFISAFRDMPLSGDFEFELLGNEESFQAGLTALSKITKTYLGISSRQKALALREAKDVEINVFDGPCPAGNVGVQINKISPVNKGEVVWTVDPSSVIFFGRLFLTGKVDLKKTIAIAGSEIKSPCYAEAIIGTPIQNIIKDNLKRTEDIRIINGNPLTGTSSSIKDYIKAHTSEITVIPDGQNTHEMFGWILPRFKQFSVSRSYFSWFNKNKEYVLDTRIKGGKRHMIMSGEYDRVFPFDIYPEYLIKAIIAGDIDQMEQLGIYEVSPEDFALAEFVDSSKLQLQRIVREGLNMLRKENA